MKIEIPGYPSLDLKYLLLDYNGTIALDGIISEAVANKIRQLSDLFHIYVLTADTNGTARQMCEGLPVDILTFPNDAAMQEKQGYIVPFSPDMAHLGESVYLCFEFAPFAHNPRALTMCAL